MEQDTTDSTNVTETELREAGASEDYIAYYKAAQRMGITTTSTRHAEKVVNRGITYSGGGFHDALWEGEARWPHNSENPYGADTTNHDILREAGVYPSSQERLTP